MFDSPFFTSEFFPLHLAIVFIFGTIFGSFFNVCIYRIPLGKSIVWPNSHCFSCGAFIPWYDNIPLVSYLLLRGRCRACGQRFSPRYFFIELLTGLLFAWVFYRYRYTFVTPLYCAVTGMLIIGTFTDFDHWIIPDSITLGGAGFALAAALAGKLFGSELIVNGSGPFSGGLFIVPFLNALTGAAAGFLILLAVGALGTLVFRKEAMGGGDVKLLAFIGAVVGWYNCLLVLIIASFVGSFFGIALLLMGKLKKMPPELLEDTEENEVSQVETIAPEAPPDSGEPGADDAKDALSQIIERQTGRKAPVVHHLPFGPYLAVATYAVLLYHREIGNLVEYLILYNASL